MHSKLSAALLIPCLFLSACGGGSKTSDTEEITYASGAKSAVVTLRQLISNAVNQNRPSANLGVFVTLYTSQGILLPTQGALLGMDAMARFLEAQLRSDTDENFALLREVGAVLQVNIVDTLNRSTKRAETLDEYTQSLKNAVILTERKLEELDVLYDKQRTDTRDKRNEVRDLERKLRTALNDQDYGEASDIEEELTVLTTEHASLEVKTDQTNDMMDRFETLLEVAQERLQAVQNNREILIAGLRVIDVPGIKDLNILEKGAKWSKRGSQSIFE